MSFAFLPDWHALLPREGGHLIAVSGFGGKSALIEAMAGVYAAEAVPTIVSARGLEAPLPELEWDALRRGVATPTVFSLVRRGDPLGAADLDALGELLPDHVVLAELGAGDPAPLPHPQPPVWPERTSLAVVVCGLDRVNRPREAVDPAGVLSPELFTATERGLVWSWTGAERWLRANLPPGDVPRAVALLRLDDCDDAIGLFAAAGRIMDGIDVPVILMGDTSGPSPRLRTAYRLDEA